MKTKLKRYTQGCSIHKLISTDSGNWTYGEIFALIECLGRVVGLETVSPLILKTIWRSVAKIMHNISRNW